MGMRNRLTRDSLEKLSDDEFDAFLDDVAENGLKEACAARIWTLGATLNWIAENDGRRERYDFALKVKAEVIAHECLGIVDGADKEDVPGAKLRADTRLKLASKWNRDRYGEAVKVQHAGTVKVDAGLVVSMGELLERAATGRLIEAELPVLTHAPRRPEAADLRSREAAVAELPLPGVAGGGMGYGPI